MQCNTTRRFGVFLLLGACGTGTYDVCPDGTTDCLNLDVQIDGEEADEAFESSDARQCTTPEGRVYVAWIDDRKNFRDVYLNSSVDGGETWFPTPIRVKQGPGDASSLDIACLGERVFLVWEDTRDSDTDYKNIYFNQSTDGGVSWENEDVRLDDDPEGRSISLAPKLAVGQGAVHVVWFDQLNGAPDIFVATSLRGNAKFEPAVRISGDPSEPGQFWAGNPRAVVGNDGRLHVVWEDARNGTQDIFYRASTADLTWPVDPEASDFQPQVRLTSGVTRGQSYGFAPSIELGKVGSGESAKDHIYVVWHDTRAGEATDIFYNYSANGGKAWFEEAARLESDAPGSAESRNPDLVVSGDVAHVVWQDNRDGGYDIYYRQIVGGSIEGSDEEDRVDNGDSKGSGNSINPVLVRRGADMVCAWEERRFGGDSGLNDVNYNYFDFDEDAETGDWDNDDYRLSSAQGGTTYTEFLNVDVAEGTVFASWVDYREGEEDPSIYFASTPVGEAVSTYEDLVTAGGVQP